LLLLLCRLLLLHLGMNHPMNCPSCQLVLQYLQLLLL
jgi:hypothetical protein